MKQSLVFFAVCICWLSSGQVHSKEIGPDEFLAVELECPTSQKPILVLTSQNVEGQRERIEIHYDNGAVSNVGIAGAEKDADFETFLYGDVRSEPDMKVRAYLANLVHEIEIQSPWMAGCTGTESEKRARRNLLHQNRLTLGVHE